MNSENKQKILTENKKLFLKTQQTTCVSNESSDVGLSYTFADNDFTNKYVSSYSHINNGFKMEKCKMSGDNKLSDNDKFCSLPQHGEKTLLRTAFRALMCVSLYTNRSFRRYYYFMYFRTP